MPKHPVKRGAKPSFSAIDFGQRGKVAHLTRFERVTVAFGGQRFYAANRGMTFSTNRKNRVLRAPQPTEIFGRKHLFNIGCNPGITPATSGTNGNNCARMKPKC